MSILGYSASYFLPSYWVNTPFYGEKLIPLLDYVLSTDYEKTDQLASAFYNIESKYKNTDDLPIGQIEAIIEESGYGYIRDLMGQDTDSLKLLVYILVMIHQLKGSKKGIETVLELLRSTDDPLTLFIVGDPYISGISEVSGFTTSDYVYYSNFTTKESFDVNFQIRTGENFVEEQCIASVANYGLYLGIDTNGRIVLRLGQQLSGVRAWQTINDSTKFVSVRTLKPNTNYFITLSFSGSEYTVKVSADGNKYSYFVAVPSSVPLDINKGIIYLGIDRSSSENKYPFSGYISLGPFAVSTADIKVTQWFETLPVGREDTFIVDAELNIGLVSSDFFEKFAHFVERYVYPSLEAFRARMKLKAKFTYLPYVRQNVSYIASNIYNSVESFMVEEENNNENHIPYEVEGTDGHDNFLVPRPL